MSARLAAADARPGSAIVEGSIAWTWQELDARADAIARELLLAGVRPGSRVAMLTAPSAAAVATLHAIARVGGVAAPLGPGLTPDELAVAGEVIAPDLVIHDPALEGSARALGGPLRSLDDLTGPSPRSDTPDALAPPAACHRRTPRHPRSSSSPRGRPAGRRRSSSRRRRWWPAPRRGWRRSPRRPAGSWRSAWRMSPGWAWSGAPPCRACRWSCWRARTPRRSWRRWAPLPIRVTSRSCRPS